MNKTVLGIDWADRRWVGVALSSTNDARVLAEKNLEDLIARASDAAVVGIDMPIGLPDSERLADVLARGYVGRRRNSVFMTPPRRVLDASTYADANVIAAELIGKKISQQAWALRHNIEAVERISTTHQTLIEVHPEVTFRRMAGHEIAFAKTTWNGQHLRRSLLADEAIRFPNELQEAGGIPVADVLDAAAAAWTARRYAQGTAESFPAGAGPGTREVIWF